MRLWLNANPDCIAWSMIACWIGAVVVLCVFAGQVDDIVAHGWRPVPR